MQAFIAIIALLPALLFSQIPELMQQYRQRLGGAVDEVSIVVRHFDEDSQRSGYDRSTALQLMSENSERLVRDQAIRWRETINRLSRLQQQQIALKDGISFAGFVAFAANYDRELLSKAYENYAAALPLSFPGAVFTISGWILSYCVLFLGWMIICWCVQLPGRAFARRMH